MASKSKTLYILPHTHWDREWYLSFASFRYRLLKGCRTVLDTLEEGGLPSFFFDGQTVVLEDLQEILDGEDARRLDRALKEGKIEAGPWYVLPDEFLISPESLVRNLQIGLQIAEEKGSRASLGYLPDTFGHISQLPGVFRSLGLEAALLFRGTETRSCLVSWQGADGTTIPGIILPLFEGYYHPWINDDDYLEKARTFLTRMAPYIQQGQVLLPAGADHTIPHKRFLSRVEETAKHNKDWEFRITTLRDYLKRIDLSHTPEILKGEQRRPGKAYVLPGVLSSRNYLKRQNSRAEELLSGLIEPFSLFLREKQIRRAYEKNLWKTLIQNHAHDSICGCSIDQVHRDNESRFRWVLEGGRAYLKDLCAQEAGQDLRAFNPFLHIHSLIPHNRRDHKIETTVFLPAGEDKGSLALLRKDGSEVPLDFLERKRDEGFYSCNDFAPGWAEGFLYRILFTLPSRGVGHDILKIVPRDVRVLSKGKTYPGSSLENPFYRVEAAADGSLTILDKRTGKTRTGLHRICSFSDHGDSYNYGPPAEDYLALARPSGQMKRVSGRNFEELTIGLELEAPRSRTDQSPARGALSLRLRLYRDDSPLSLLLKTENIWEDRKLVLCFPLEGGTTESWGDTAFDFVRRDIPAGDPLHTAPRHEASRGIYSSLRALHAGGISLSHRGINEYEIHRGAEEETLLYCTLLRSTSHLSLRDLSSRGGGAGPVIPTPEGQCPGSHEWEYALSLENREDLPALTSCMQTPFLVHQGRSDQEAEFQLLLEEPKLVVTALRRLTDREILLRLYNPLDRPLPLHVSGSGQLRLFESDLRERKREPYARPLVHPKEILTLRIEH